jgi:hypothetical protein
LVSSCNFIFLYFLEMSTPERPTNFPPKESLSRDVGEFVGSPSGSEISDGSGHHIPTPPSSSGSAMNLSLRLSGSLSLGFPKVFLSLGLHSHFMLPPYLSSRSL